MPPVAATASLINSLEEVRRRVQRLSVFRGVGRIISLGLASVLAFLLLDYFLSLPVAPRVFLFVIFVGGLFVAAVRWIAWPLARQMSLSDVAGRLETRFPEFDDGLRSTIDFLRPEIPGSSAMKSKAVERAVLQAQKVKLESAIDPSSTWIAFGQAAGVFILLLMVAVAVGPQIRATAFAHLFDPFSHRAWPRRVEIASESTIPARVPVGQRIDIYTRLVRGDRNSIRSTLCYRYGTGPVQQELMTRGSDGVYSATLEPRIDSDKQSEKLSAWIKAGDDQLDLSAVTVVSRLALRSIQARVSPPPYVIDSPVSTVDLSTGPASMVEGSIIELMLGFNKPLADAGRSPGVQLIRTESPDARASTTQPNLPTVTWISSDSATVVGRFGAKESMRFHVHAMDADGFANSGIEEYQLIVRPDQMPSVQIEEPRQNEERTSVATIPLHALAEDDLGIDSLSLIVDRIQRGGVDSLSPTLPAKPATSPADASRWTIPLVIKGKAAASIDWSPVQGTGERKRFRAIDAWELAALKDANLRGGDVLEYRMLVTDNYLVDGVHHPAVSSGKLRINIISQDDLTNRVIADLQALKTQVDELKATQARASEETRNLADDLKNKPRMDNADKSAAQRLGAEQSSAAGRAQQLAERAAEIGKRLAENHSSQQDLATLSHDVQSDLNQTAEDPMKSATQKLSALPDSVDSQKRSEMLDQIKSAQAAANEDLQRALDRLGNIGSLQQTIAKINELLKLQRAASQQTREAGKNTLGKGADQINADDRKKLDAAAAEQAKLADQTTKAIEEMKKGAEQLAKSDPSAAEAMSKAAQTASQQQVSANQKKAAEQTKSNQQSSAQSAQQQVELGLQMMANDLQQAERRKLAQLAKQLEELQQQIANLIRRQAGHNLDNLAVQGPAATQPAATLTDLNSEAERDASFVPPDPRRLADTLAPSQEQTSTNARDLSKASEAMASGGAAASQLLRAADHMDRALVSLHESRFAAAFDPPQTEALASLLAAKKTVDQQKATVDDQINQGQKEAVRQKYVKLKEDQIKLNADVTRIDAIRDAGTPLKRPDGIRLGQLPGEQGALADRVTELDKDLAAVDSIVFTWANRDIAAAMTSAKGGIPDTAKDAETLDTQGRIVDELDAMIRDLQTKPKVSKFANDNHGGGGGGKGGGSKPMPPEAELRLLRSLQQAVNAKTKTIDATGVKNAPQAAAIGGRQGELRRILGELLEKSSGGKVKLGPEPDNKDLLPEEATGRDVDDNELDQHLLTDKPEADPAADESNLVGQRMARSRQRLALNDDPGKVTQIIQDKIVHDLDSMIDEAAKQQSETRNSSEQKGKPQQQTTPGEKMANAEPQKSNGKSKPGDPSQSPAQLSTATPPGGGAVDISRQIKESLAEWGQITPRLRAAQIEGSSESIVEQYRKLTEDYYRSLAAKAAQR